MKHPIIITSSGKIFQKEKQKQKVKISLPYSFISRRILIEGLNVPLGYNIDIDTSAIK
jgi:hypothetical protein